MLLQRERINYRSQGDSPDVANFTIFLSEKKNNTPPAKTEMSRVKFADFGRI